MLKDNLIMLRKMNGYSQEQIAENPAEFFENKMQEFMKELSKEH